MTRLLIRTYRDPFALAPAEEVLARDLFGGNNNGNLLFSDAAVRALAVDGVEVTCQPLDNSPLSPEEVNERFDHVVFPLANAFRASFGKRLQAHTRFIRKLTIPVTVVGIGAQSDIDFGFETLASVDDTVRDFVGAVLDRGPAIGVRGEFTASYLRHLGFSDVEVIGCPSMFMKGADLQVREPPSHFDESSLIGFNLTPKVEQALQVALALLRRYPRFTYFPQHKRELETMLWGRPAGSATDGVEEARLNRLTHPLFTGGSARVHVHPLPWIEDLARFDFNLGTRIHGNLAAILGGTPSHLLAADSRTREMAEYFELPYTRVVDLPVDVDLDELTAGHDYAAVARGHQGRFERYTGFLESHGLAHLWQPGAVSTWDRRLEGRVLPRPVVTDRDTPVDMIERIGWVKYRQDDEVARLEARAQRQTAQLRRLARDGQGPHGRGGITGRAARALQARTKRG
jgi:hypothetical protein